jgi:adenylate cyclase
VIGAGGVENGTRPEQGAADARGATVDQLLRHAEIEAERVIGWVRVAVGVMLAASGIFVSFGSKALTAGQHVNFLTGLSAVGAYVALGAISLALVARGRFRPWMAFALVTADAAVLAFGLHTLLGSMGLGGNWISIVPVIWVAPLALVVGALRYRPIVQAWATAAMVLALAGVAIGLGFQTSLAPAEADVGPYASIVAMHDLPPFIMRAVMLLLMGMITILVILRSRQLLRRAVAETVRTKDLSRFLPAEIAPLVETGGLAGLRQGRRQEAVIIFVDIRGSTALAEHMDPERLSIFITSFRRRVMRAATEHGGLVDKFIGDGALVVFGVPELKGDEAERALAFAARLLGYIDQWNIKRRFDPPVRVGIGIHRGEIYWGLVGDARRIELTVLGDAVNVAAKIEQATKAYKVPLLVSGSVLAGAGSVNGWSEIGHQPLGGRHEAIVLYARREDQARV